MNHPIEPPDWRAPVQIAPPKKKMRTLSWVIIGFNVLMLVWMVGGSISAANHANCAAETGTEFFSQADAQDVCEGATAIGTGIAVFGLLFLTMMVDVILGVIWIVTRKHHQYTPAPVAPPAPAAPPPAPGWHAAQRYPRPSAHFWKHPAAEKGVFVLIGFVLGLVAYGVIQSGTETGEMKATTAAAAGTIGGAQLSPAPTPAATAPTTTTTAAPTTTTTSRNAAKLATFPKPTLVQELDDGGIVGIHRMTVGGGSAYFKPAAGKEYRNFDVEICGGSIGGSANPLQFEASMKDNTRRTPHLLDIAEPGLPAADLSPGECVRGWVTFEVPAGQMAQLRYKPNYITGPTLAWTLT
jgi:hypothetical protein